jgi:hypothetical protein
VFLYFSELNVQNTEELGNSRATTFGVRRGKHVLRYAVSLESTPLLFVYLFLETTLICEY